MRTLCWLILGTCLAWAQSPFFAPRTMVEARPSPPTALPDVRGQDRHEAERRFRARGVEKVGVAEIVSPGNRTETVVEQRPAGGQPAAGQALIYVAVPPKRAPEARPKATRPPPWSGRWPIFLLLQAGLAAALWRFWRR